MDNENKTFLVGKETPKSVSSEKRTKKIYNYDTKKYNKEYYVKHKEENNEKP